MKKLQKITLASVIPVTIVILLTYMLTTDTSQARHDHKYMILAGQINEERYRLDNGISDIWYEWRDDLQNIWLNVLRFHQKKR